MWSRGAPSEDHTKTFEVRTYLSLSPRITGAVATAAAASTTRAARRRGGRGVAWTCWRESRQSSRRRCLYPVSSSARNDPTAVETHRPAQRCAVRRPTRLRLAVALVPSDSMLSQLLAYGWDTGRAGSSRGTSDLARVAWSTINFTKPDTICFDCSAIG